MGKELPGSLERAGNRDEVVIGNLTASLKDLATNYDWFDSFDEDRSGVPSSLELPDDFEETLPRVDIFMKAILKGFEKWEVTSRGVLYQLTSVIGDGDSSQTLYCLVDTITGMFAIQRIGSDGSEIGAFSHNPQADGSDDKIITAKILTRASRRHEDGSVVVPVLVEYSGRENGYR